MASSGSKNNPSSDANNDDSAAALRSLGWIGSGVILVVVIAVAVLMYNFQTDKTGQIGDTIGGILNPALTFLSFIAVVMALFLQQRELSLALNEYRRSAGALEDQRSELIEQRSNAIFLMMIEVHRHNVDGTQVGGRDNPYVGRKAFGILKTLYSQKYEYFMREPPGDPTSIDIIRRAHNEFRRDQDVVVRHYINTLRHIVKYVEATFKNPDPYMDILRSQLSKSEIFCITYDCLARNELYLLEKFSTDIRAAHDGGDFFLRPEHLALLNNALAENGGTLSTVAT